MALFPTDWVSALAVHPERRIIETVAVLSEDWIIHSFPHAGMDDAPVTESSRPPRECSLGSAWVEVHQPDGRCGAGLVRNMRHRGQLAWALAVCDAILTSKLDGWQEIMGLVESGKAILEKRRVNPRAAMLSHPRQTPVFQEVALECEE